MALWTLVAGAGAAETERRQNGRHANTDTILKDSLAFIVFSFSSSFVRPRLCSPRALCSWLSAAGNRRRRLLQFRYGVVMEVRYPDVRPSKRCPRRRATRVGAEQSANQSAQLADGRCPAPVCYQMFAPSKRCRTGTCQRCRCQRGAIG